MLTRDKSIKLLLNHPQPTETLDSSTCLRVFPSCGGTAAKAAGEETKKKQLVMSRDRKKKKNKKNIKFMFVTDYLNYYLKATALVSRLISEVVSEMMDEEMSLHDTEM